MKSGLMEQLLAKHCRKDGWGMPRDELAQMGTVMALAFKDFPDHAKYNAAVSILRWASTRPDLELIERAGKIWDDLVLMGKVTAKPDPWACEPVNPAEVMPPLPCYCTAEQLAYKAHPLWS